MSYFSINDIQASLKRMLSKHLEKGMTLYDIGCGKKPYQSHVESLSCKYVGVDIEDGFYDSSHIDLIGDAYKVPAEDASVDAVISAQVIEHLYEPVKAIQETGRILKKGGLFFITFPMLYPVHAMPRDYFRYTDFCFENIAQENGFEVLEKERLCGFWYCAGDLLGLYLQTFDRSFMKKFKIMSTLIWLIKVPFLLIHKLEGWVLKTFFNKDPDEFRQIWTTNYTYVLKKI